MLEHPARWLTLRLLGIEDECAQPIVGCVDHTSVLERDLRAEYSTVCGRRGRIAFRHC